MHSPLLGATLAFVLVAPSASAQQQQQQQPTPASVAARVQAFYAQTNTYRADFQQTFHVRAYNLTKRSSGTVVFEKPGKMRWDYASPAGNVVVCNGSQLSVYEAANAQMFVQSVSGSQYPAALSFLNGTGNLAATHALTLATPAQRQAMGFIGGEVLIGTPTPPSPAYTKALFFVDGQSGQVRRVMLVDAQGNRNRFDFSNANVNAPVSAALFTFTPPQGTTIVQVPAPPSGQAPAPSASASGTP